MIDPPTVSEEYPHEKPKNRFWLGVIASTTFVVVCIGILWWWMDQDSIGVITTPPPAEKPVDTRGGEQKKWVGAYLSFAYPSDYEIRTADTPPVLPILERLVLSRNDVEGQKIVVMIQDNTGYSLPEYGGYRIRDMAPGEYTKEIIEVQNKSYTLFIREKSVFEAGAFWQVGSRAYSLITSSPIQATGLRDDLIELLKTTAFPGN